MTQPNTFIVTTNDLDTRDVYASAFTTYEAAKEYALKEVETFGMEYEEVDNSTRGVWHDNDYEVFQIEIHETFMDNKMQKRVDN